jgi:hypothetical protein
MLMAGTKKDPQVIRTVGFEKLATGLLVPLTPVPVPRIRLLSVSPTTHHLDGIRPSLTFGGVLYIRYAEVII